MCGIAGIFNKDKSTVESSSIKRMTDAMPHRGPDADGVFCNGNVGLGHRRLSIIDLSVEANQPFSDTAGRYK
ncbi:MAG: hypothetical protein IPP79_09670 [Chitinophagaceae bacterium]|nr:hypothetical protein [Chitinophagaceae bacterium]